MKDENITCTEPGHFAYGSAEEPTLQPGNALIKIKRVGICGTDLHAFEGTQAFFNYPRILDHELAEELVDFDDAPGFEKGEEINFYSVF